MSRVDGMLQPEAVFQMRQQHTIYVTTDSLELGAILHKQGYVEYQNNKGVYFFGPSRRSALTVKVEDVDMKEAALKAREIGFQPQGRLTLRCTGCNESYAQAASAITMALAEEHQWYAICGLREPYVYKGDPLGPIRWYDADFIGL